MRMLHREGISGVSADGDLKTDVLHRSSAIITSSVIPVLSCFMSARNAKLFSNTIYHDTLDVLFADCASFITAPGQAVTLKPTPCFDLCDIHLINFSTHSFRRYTKSCQLSLRCAQRHRTKCSCRFMATRPF